MADPKHPRHFSDDFKRQVVELRNAGKPMSEIMAECDLGRSTVRRWITYKRHRIAPRGRQPHARPDKGHRARAREPQAAHGGRRFKNKRRRCSRESDGDGGERRPLPGIGATRCPRRAKVDLLRHALAGKRAEGARPHRARRAGGPRGEPRPLRLAQDKGGAG